MWPALILWTIWFAAGLTIEALGLAGVGGIWPLTWLVRDALDHDEPVAGLGIFMICGGFPLWLLWHFLVEKRAYGKRH